MSKESEKKWRKLEQDEMKEGDHQMGLQEGYEEYEESKD